MNGDSRYIDERPGSWEMERLEEAGARMRARALQRAQEIPAPQKQDQEAEEPKEGE
tara:strand:- start:923 stop:1090 length:168 start_codon:yes stop_codon:yes gene_type:complete